jgi:gingipain R
MKKWLIVIIIGINFLRASYEINLLEDRGERITLEFILKEYKIENVNINGIECSKVYVPGHLNLFLIKGYPELPKFARSVIIPDNGIMNFRIKDIEYEIIKVNPVVPSKGNLKRNVNPEDIPYEFSDFYKKDEWFPKENIEISKPFILREFRGLTCYFYPFQYNPKKGELKVFKKIVVEIYKEKEGGENILIRKRNTIAKPFVEIYENFFLNYESVRQRYPFLKDTVGNMLIITADNYYNNIQPFVYWKKKKGINVKVEKISNIGNNPTNIKNYIQNYYNNYGVTWIILVGNANDVATIPSPEGYDETCDPVYAFLAGNDRYFDAFVSRFSANNATHIDLQVLKTVKYERYPPQGATWEWYRRACGTASNEGSPTDCERLEWLTDTLLSYTYTYADQLCAPTANDQMILNALSGGRSILNHIGHGNETGFGAPPYFWIDINEISTLTNTNMLTFAFFVACLVGDFDAVPTCCCEQWVWTGNLENPRGGIAAYGASVLQSWVPPTLSQLHAMGILKRERATTFGGLCFNGSMYMYEQTNDLEMLETWHIFGDASCDLRTTIPDTFNVSHPQFTPPGPGQFTVLVKKKDGITPIKDALVCLWIPTQSPEIHLSGYTDVEGKITFNINPQNPLDTIFITVTKHNYVPYEGYAIVLDVGMPATPTIVSPLDFARLPGLNPTLKFYSTDPQNEGIEYRVKWSLYPDFSISDSLTTSVYPSGQVVSVTLPNLQLNKTYWWKVKCRDPQGSGYWTPYTQKRSFTVSGGSLPENTCSWFQETGAQFSYNTFNGTKVEGDSVVLIPTGGTVVCTLLFENFEQGVVPPGWTVIDGNNDGFKWTVGTTSDLGGYTPPNYGTKYAYYSDDDAGNGVINYNEELWTPKVAIPQSASNLTLKYGYGFQVYQPGEKFRVHFRKKVGSSWTNWQEVRVYMSSISGTDSIDLTNQLPCDSIQFRFFYSDSTAYSHWGWACASDNVLIKYSYELQNNFGTMLTVPVLYSELNNTFPRTSWGDIIVYKGTEDDSICIQVEYFDGSNWNLVPESLLPGNSTGIYGDTISINNLPPDTYHTLRVKCLFYRKIGETPQNPTLRSLEVGNLARISEKEKGVISLIPFINVSRNIFKGNLIISYSIPERIDKISLRIYDVNGRCVKDLSKKLIKGKESQIVINNLKKGVYFIKFKAGEYRKDLKVIKIK